MTQLISPAIQLHHILTPKYTSDPNTKVKLFSQNRQLVILHSQVILINGTNVSKKFTFDEPVVAATFTDFNGIISNDPDANEVTNSNSYPNCLVICLSKSAFIYCDGRNYTINLPFGVKNALPFEYGLILDKQVHSGDDNNHHHYQLINSAKFLSLVDPMGELRIIASSTTSIISPHEELMTFPINKSCSLCATFNGYDSNITLYHIKITTRNPPKRTPSNHGKYYKRKNTFMATPNPSRILEDESTDPPSSFHLDPHSIPNNNNNNNNNLAVSVNMEKKRTSTLLSDASSMARMSSEVSIPPPSDNLKPLDYPGVRRDIILTKVDGFNFQLDKKYLSIYNSSYDDQEAIIIMNRYKNEARVYIFNQLLMTSSVAPQYQLCYSFKCHDCMVLKNDQFPGYLVTLVHNDTDSSQIQLVNPFVDIKAPPIDLSLSLPPIQAILDCYDQTLALSDIHNRNHIIKLVLLPSCDVVFKCLQCFKYLSGSNINETIWVLWRTALMLDDWHDDWRAFVIALLSVILPFDMDLLEYHYNEITQLLPQAKKLRQLFTVSYSFRDMIPYILLSLHLIREEVKLDILAHSYLDKLGLVLTQICSWVGWPGAWLNYYMIDSSLIDYQVRLPLVFVLPTPPNILESLTSLFGETIIPYLTFSQLVEENFTIDSIVIPRTHAILKLFELIVSPNFGSSNIVDMMCEFDITIEMLETYPPGISIPLKEAILSCQVMPNFHWTDKALHLIDRKDLNMFLSSESYQPPTSLYSSVMPNNTVKSVDQIVNNLLDKNDHVVAWDDQSEADRIGITKLIFDYDRRYYEITTLLHQTKTQMATLITEEGLNEYDTVILQRELAAIVALRTLSIPLGRASLFYAGRMPLLTEKFPIPKFNLNTLIAPTMTNIILSDGAVDEKVIEWGYFHNGVASGLSISKKSKGISGSWIIFNKPPSLNSQHAGFLLGLGLNGHLKKLEEWHVYNYLGPKHPLTSLGLLIGMSASNMRSMDIKLTKVLSVHAVALLPQGANDLNVPVIVQTAGLLGIGLLYLESQHRRMSEILLSQITSTVSQNDTEQIHEGYRLAAGIALGFINLGKSRDLKGLNDTRLVDRLLALATSMKDFQPVEELDKSCSGAIIALGFINMKSQDSTIANKLAVPFTEQLLDYIRPDLLLLRCVSKHIIMWNDIGNSIDWVELEIPPVLLKKYGKRTIESLDSDQVGYFNIVGGNCMAMAIKYASTHDIGARNTLLHYLDKMRHVSMCVATNYDQRIAGHSANNIQNLLALCLSVIMAGSGDLETFRRLRNLYGETTRNVEYGNYMAINMALGFLFLGGGQYAFGNSNLAIACLIVSLYPIFPSGNGDYEVHLQALRHFWTLAVESRCLVVRDVDSHKACKVPVTIKLKNGTRKEVITPSLLPNLNEILTIETESLDHFKVNIDFDINSTYLKIFQESLTIFVYKKRNYELLKSNIRTLLNNENRELQIDNQEINIDKDVAKILQLDIMKSISHQEKRIYQYESSDFSGNDSIIKDSGLSIFNIIDNKIELQSMAQKATTVDDLYNLKLIFAYSERLFNDDMHYLTVDFIEMLKHIVWELGV